MSRRLMVSVLFGLSLLAMSALGQPPANPLQPKDKKDEKKANPVDALIAAALANDPDLRMAKAKLQLAEAELAKARQAVAVKVITLSAAIEEQKRQVASFQERVAWTARMVEKGFASETQLLADREKVESAKAKLSQLETDLKLMTGGGPLGGAADGSGDRAELLDLWKIMPLPETASALAAQRYAEALQRYYEVAGKAQAATGPIADRIRAALNKPVKLGPRDAKVTFDQAMEIFKKEAGLDVPVRGGFPPSPLVKQPSSPEIVSQGETLPVGAWLQMFEDLGKYRQSGSTRHQFYVREYGLLIAPHESAPPDALTITQFWKQKAENAATIPKR